MSHFRPILRDHDITEQQWRVIRALHHSPGYEITELGEICLILTPSLTRILRALESKNLVKRETVKSDQRRSFISLSIKGKKLFQTISPISEAEYERITSLMGEKKITQLYKLLDEVSEIL